MAPTLGVPMGAPIGAAMHPAAQVTPRTATMGGAPHPAAQSQSMQMPKPPAPPKVF